MRLRFLAMAALLLPVASPAAPWQFDPPIAVSSASGPRLFHHVESAGRRNIAVSGKTVAVVWEDDRDGIPRIYMAHKGLAEAAFGEEIVISGEGEAYEPSVVALEDGRFAVAWEEEGLVYARLVGGDMPGPALKLAAAEAAQASLAVNGSELLLVAAERQGRFPRIMLHRLRQSEGARLTEVAGCAVDAEPPRAEQLYPTLVVQQGRVIAAWEDRRPGHTIILASESKVDAMCPFPPPQRISLRPRRGQKMPYGKGHGVSRVAMAAYGESGVLAAWADKRDFREGYDIYAAAWRAAGGFGDNERVQDEFGGVARQWHTTVAGHPDGTLLVAWDDDRDGDTNVMISWREDGAWSEDTVLPGAGGPGEQAHPSITLDRDGNLHAVWVERDTSDGPTRLRYALGRAVKE